ncbi:hypothetical protein LINPERPRIM_LOCUS13707 [Linum perenne]
MVASASLLSSSVYHVFVMNDGSEQVPSSNHVVYCFCLRMQFADLELMGPEVVHCEAQNPGDDQNKATTDDLLGSRRTMWKQEIVLFQNCGRQKRSRGDKKKDKKSSGSRNYYYISRNNPFAVLCRRDVAKDCFFSTIHLKPVDCSNRQERWTQYMKKMKIQKQKKEEAGRKLDSTHVGNKVLPVAGERSPSPPSKTAATVNKTRGVSRMKELVRWAAGAKSDKKVRNRGARKAEQDAVSMVSSSSAAAVNCDRKGNWITTDSECASVDTILHHINLIPSGRFIHDIMSSVSERNIASKSIDVANSLSVSEATELYSTHRVRIPV